MGFKKAGNELEKLLLNIAGPRLKTFAISLLAWNNVVGSLLSERTFVCKLENHILYVAVANSVWMQEMIFLKLDLMKKMNRIDGIKIKDIVFFIREKND